LCGYIALFNFDLLPRHHDLSQQLDAKDAWPNGVQLMSDEATARLRAATAFRVLQIRGVNQVAISALLGGLPGGGGAGMML
jgi:hypothetical protein